MNIFYYPQILIDNIDKIMLDNSFCTYILIFSICAVAVSSAYFVWRSRIGKVINAKLWFIIAVSGLFLVISSFFVWYVSIPAIFFLSQFLLFMFNWEMNNKFKKSTAYIFFGVFTAVSIALNFLC